MSSNKPKVVVPSPRPVAVREIQLIDRAEEMQILREAADKAVRGEGGVIFLHGEAGIGKTRLARELGVYARSQGMRVLSGRCPALFRMDGVPPYVLWEEVIKDYLETCTPEQLYRVVGSYPVEVSKLVPELKQKLRTFPQSFPLSPEHSRDRLFEAVTQFVTNISKENPLLVVLDDLQWTDQSSLLLLHYLARGIHKDSLLLLGAYRETHIDDQHPLSPVLTELNRERLLQSVSLKRMSFDDVLEMIKQLLEQDEVAKEFCQLIFDKTRGNPFFVEEVIRSLKEEEIIYRKENKWKIKKVSQIKFPKTIKSVVKKRIGRLEDESQNVLTMASFIGKDFTFEVLCKATGVGEDELLETIEKMLKTGLIKEREVRGEAVYSFADVIVRDVVHDEASLLRRRRLHNVVGHALEEVYAKKIDKHLGELALHFLEGGEKEKALSYFLKAGEKAAKIYANKEAASYMESALEILEERERSASEIGPVLERLGDIKTIIGEHDASMKYWRRALSQWKQAHKKKTVSRLHRKIANVLWEVMGDPKGARKQHDQALKALEGEPKSVVLASLYEDMAHMYYRTGEMTAALSWAEKALKLAEELNAFEVIASAYTSLGTILSYGASQQKALKCLYKGLRIALDNGYMETALRAYNNLATELGGVKNEESMENIKKGYELARKVGHVQMQSWIGNGLAAAYGGMGNMQKAVSLVEESVALDRKAGDMSNLAYSLLALGLCFRVLGERDRCIKCYEEGLIKAQNANLFQLVAGAYGGFGSLYHAEEQYVKAREYREKTYKILEEAGAKTLQIAYSAELIWTYIELGEMAKAENLYEILHKSALQTKDKRLIALDDLTRARQLRAQKEWKKSIEHFEKALEQAEALGSRQWDMYSFARHSLLEYARVYLDRNQAGDREKARDLLTEALEIFERMGAKKDIEETKLKLALSGAAHEVTEPEPEAGVIIPSHIKTGHVKLDDLLGGGIPNAYAVILTSPSCDERDMLIKSFLETGARKGEATFDIVAKASETNRLAENYQPNFHLVICNPEADAIIRNLPNIFKLKGVENLNDINIALTSTIRKLAKKPGKARRVCIEIVSDVLLQHQTVQTRRWLNALIPKLKSEGFTILAVMDAGMHSPQEVRAVLDLFEGEISIYEKQTEKGTEKLLKIKKMTNQEYSKNELHLHEEEPGK